MGGRFASHLHFCTLFVGKITYPQKSRLGWISRFDDQVLAQKDCELEKLCLSMNCMSHWPEMKASGWMGSCLARKSMRQDTSLVIYDQHFGTMVVSAFLMKSSQATIRVSQPLPDLQLLVITLCESNMAMENPPFTVIRCFSQCRCPFSLGISKQPAMFDDTDG